MEHKKADAGIYAPYENVMRDCSMKRKVSDLVAYPATTRKTEKRKPTLYFRVREFHRRELNDHFFWVGLQDHRSETSGNSTTFGRVLLSIPMGTSPGAVCKVKVGSGGASSWSGGMAFRIYF
jgi:hypothetical protein